MSEDLYQVINAISKSDGKNRSQAVQSLCMRGLAHMKLLDGKEDLLLHTNPIKLLKLSRKAYEESIPQRTLEEAQEAVKNVKKSKKGKK